MKKLLKKIYSAIPFKKTIYSALKAVYVPPQSIYQHLHFHGNYSVRLPENKKFKIRHYGFFIENEVFWAGFGKSWEQQSLSLWIKLCKKSNVIFDIGANTGIYSLAAKAVNPQAKVYAFEPVSRVFEKLHHNIQINNYDIVAVEKAVSNSNGKAVILDTNSEHTYSVTVNAKRIAGDENKFESIINTVTLDSFFREHGISNVDLMKIDVETHEPEVLEGFAENLKKYRPAIFIEILNEEVGHAVNKMVEGLGYLYYNIDEDDGIRKEDNILKSDYYNYLLCTPEQAKYLQLPV